MSNTFKGFKDFLLRGNILELAISFVIGLAFVGADRRVLRSLRPARSSTRSSGAASPAGRSSSATASTSTSACFLNAVIVFVITAAVLYFVFVLPLNTLRERRAKGEEAEPRRPSSTCSARSATASTAADFPRARRPEHTTRQKPGMSAEFSHSAGHSGLLQSGGYS